MIVYILYLQRFYKKGGFVMNYYNEVENYIKKVEIGKAIRKTAANNELVDAYWNVGKLIVEAQGGKEKAKYGNELIKKWAERLTSEYGKGYNYTNLSRFRQFYLSFPILAPVGNVNNLRTRNSLFIMR